MYQVPEQLKAKIAGLQSRIHAWSMDNFGDNVSTVTGQKLGSLCSVLGIIEENSEHDRAFRNADGEEVLDAIADTMIYLMDYCSREGVAFCDINPDVPEMESLDPYGRLAHITLKRHQGIRGFANDEHYAAHRDEVISHIIGNLCWEYYFNQEEVDPDSIDALGEDADQSIYESYYERVIALADDVFSKVAQRNWKRNPDNANEVTQATEASAQ